MDNLSATDLKSILIDTDFTGGTGLYYAAKKDYERLKSDHKMINKKLFDSQDN
jgi:hypothetical protein